jgi:hypothetical protein
MLGLILLLQGWGVPLANAQAPDPAGPVEQIVINSPPTPPAEILASRAQEVAPDSFSATSVPVLLPVPAYTWVLGCSPVSAAMIAAYYDRNNFPQIYTGPANGGVMPADNNAWPTWSDGSMTFPSNPLIASRAGVDGRTARGTIEDYWVKSNSTSPDPYLANQWPQHASDTAIGDYMKTSQSIYSNVDGSTHFYSNQSSGPLTCNQMQSQGIQDDGTVGRKRFYEARGYAVSDCYNQNIDANNGGGFTYAMYKAEIDSGHPVMLNLAGHTIVGLGYDPAGTTVYIHDTWDRNTYSMPWGGSYANMRMLSVSIVHPVVPGAPGPFNKTGPTVGVSGQAAGVTLSWAKSSSASRYEYCADTTNDNACSNWVNAGTATSVSLSKLTNNTTYYWQVRAVNATGATYANTQVWWSFRTLSAGSENQRIYLPSVQR